MWIQVLALPPPRSCPPAIVMTVTEPCLSSQENVPTVVPRKPSRLAETVAMALLCCAPPLHAHQQCCFSMGLPAVMFCTHSQPQPIPHSSPLKLSLISQPQPPPWAPHNSLPQPTPINLWLGLGIIGTLYVAFSQFCLPNGCCFLL